jgi:hypothetical protein
MPLEAAIIQSKGWMTECSSLIDGTSFERSNRLRVSASFLHLCIEHQQGIHTLIEHGLVGSASALLRPQFEAYVRGIWYHQCAADSQITSFLQGAQPPKISPLLAALKAIPDFDGETIERTKKDVWRTLNDFTHGGAIQVKARNTADEIVRNYTPEHVVGLLRISASLTLLAGTGISAIANIDTLAQSLYALYKRIYQQEA